MKKLFFYASALALLASCAEDDLNSSSANKNNAGGITFEAISGNDASTRGELTLGAQVGFFWYAEQDAINILAKTNVQGGASNVSNAGIVSNWTGTLTPATYKATKSAGKGEFTATAPDQIIEFASVPTTQQIASKTTTFVASYKSTVTEVKETSGEVTELSIKPVAGNANIDLSTGGNISEYMPMYSVSYAYPSKNYHSVGEKVGLEFYRPYATLAVTANSVGQYNTLFGKLQKVTVTTKGYTPAAGATGNVIPASGISYTPDSVLVVNVAEPLKTKSADANAVTNPTNHSIEITYGVANNQGVEWKDGNANALLFPSLNVDRAAFVEANVKESVEVKYEFENITFTESANTDQNWKAFTEAEAPTVKVINTLDVDAYSYLVVGNQSPYSLIVNSGEFSDIYYSAAKTSVAWGGTAIALADFNRIISNVELSTDELANIKNFTGLEEITLKKNTALPAKTFKAQTGLKVIDMPLVTTIDNNFAVNAAGTAIANFTALQTLKLPAYMFENAEVNKVFFNASTKNSLEILDMSRVENMLPTFGIDRSLSFEGFALKEVTVQNGMKVSPNAFKDCKKLYKVTGTVDLLNGENAFMNAGSQSSGNNTTFTTINVNRTEFPASVFEGCSTLVNIKYNNAQVIPTKVGKSAFKGCALVYMDLSKVTELGESAFEKSKLQLPYKGAPYMVIGASTIPTAAFANTQLEMVQFSEATTIYPDILKSTTLKHLKFSKAFTVAKKTGSNIWNNTFGTASNIDLFINPEQEYMEGTTMQLPLYNASLTNVVGYDNVSFKTVQREE